MGRCHQILSLSGVRVIVEEAGGEATEAPPAEGETALTMEEPNVKPSVYDEQSLQRGWAGVQSWPEYEHVRFERTENTVAEDTTTRVATGAPGGEPEDGPNDHRDEDRGFNGRGNNCPNRRPYPQRNGAP